MGPCSSEMNGNCVFFTFISKFQQVSNLISSSLLLLVIPHYSSGILRAVLFVAVLQRDVDLQYMRADWNVAAAAVWEAFWRELNKYQRKLKKGNDDLIFTSFGYGFIYFLFRSPSAVCRFFFFTHLTHHSSLFLKHKTIDIYLLVLQISWASQTQCPLVEGQYSTRHIWWSRDWVILGVLTIYQG